MPLPTDPAILQSYLNTLLRDHYPSLRALCSDRGYDYPALLRRLAEAHLEYNPQLNKIW